ncbi:MAG: IPT/TIG domain-containing protein, partial [Myxococcota bacterium]
MVSVAPAAGPAAGGTEVTVTGTGFRVGMAVRIGDVPLAEINVVDANTVTGRTVAGSHGPADVEVRVNGLRAELPAAFRFEEAFEVVRIEPIEGSIAGNTYVSVIGRGLGTGVPGELGVDFGAQTGLGPQLENGSVLGVRAPAAAAGLVDVAVRAGSGRDASLADAYTYFNPRLLAGGAWGGAIEGAVNVAVLDGSGQPLPGFTVQLGTEADPLYRGLTDANGLATISSPEIRGAQTVTVGREEQEFVTFMDINARNLTMFSAGYPQVQPPDAPVFPCPEPQQAPIVRGRIFELKSALDPETNPDIIPLVRITYTQANVFSPNPAEPPEQFDFVFAEGEEYEIVVTRAGTVAVYAILGDFNQTTQEFIPRQMGIARGIPVAPDTVTENVDIALNIEMDQTLRVRLDNPPNQNPGPSLSAVFPFLNLDSDGVIPFDATFVPSGGELVLRNMPALAESQFFYMGGSFTQGTTGLSSPYSLTLVESSASAEDGVDLGPYLEMPTNVQPKAGELLTNGRLSWNQGGPTPDLTTLAVVDVGTAGGQCCIDINM